MQAVLVYFQIKVVDEPTAPGNWVLEIARIPALFILSKKSFKQHKNEVANFCHTIFAVISDALKLVEEMCHNKYLFLDTERQIILIGVGSTINTVSPLQIEENPQIS